jgi:threonine dehydrogenase-like Zn-dependent dehydrogenase
MKAPGRTIGNAGTVLGYKLKLFLSTRIAPTQRLLAKGVFDQKKLITHVMDYHQIQEMLTIAEGKSDGYIKGVITFK